MEPYFSLAARKKGLKIASVHACTFASVCADRRWDGWREPLLGEATCHLGSMAEGAWGDVAH